MRVGEEQDFPVHVGGVQPSLARLADRRLQVNRRLQHLLGDRRLLDVVAVVELVVEQSMSSVKGILRRGNTGGEPGKDFVEPEERERELLLPVPVPVQRQVRQVQEQQVP